MMTTRDHSADIIAARRFFRGRRSVAYLWEESSPELLFLYRVLRHLVDDRAMRGLSFYVTNQEPLPRCGRDVVAIQIGNEDHAPPSFAGDVLLTFTPYPSFAAPGNLLPIPLGYNGHLPEMPVKPFADRPVDAFFSGQRTNDRWMIGESTALLATRPAHAGRRFNVEYTERFLAGMNPADYARALMDARIAIAPRGTISPVTFRFFEAARSGNAIISCILPDTWYYRPFPGVQLDDWTRLPDVLDRLLADPASLETMHARMLSYYDRFCSERAVAGYMKRAIVHALSAGDRDAVIDREDREAVGCR